MRNFPEVLATQIQELERSLERYGYSRWWRLFSRPYTNLIKDWTEADVTRLKTEVLQHDNRFWLARLFGRFFSYIEFKRSLLCYYEIKKLMQDLKNPEAVLDLTSWQTTAARTSSSTWLNSDQLRRLSSFSRLRGVIQPLLKLIRGLTDHFAPATPQVAIVATNIVAPSEQSGAAHAPASISTHSNPAINSFEQDYATFDVLCRQTAASAEDVKKAYSRLAMLYHPDKDPDNPNSTQNMQRITRRYAEFKQSQETAANPKSLEQLIREVEREIAATMAKLREDLRADTATFRADLQADADKRLAGLQEGLRADRERQLAALRVGMNNQVARLQTETASLRTDIDRQIAGLQEDLRAHTDRQIADLTGLQEGLRAHTDRQIADLTGLQEGLRADTDRQITAMVTGLQEDLRTGRDRQITAMVTGLQQDLRADRERQFDALRSEFHSFFSNHGITPAPGDSVTAVQSDSHSSPTVAPTLVS